MDAPSASALAELWALRADVLMNLGGLKRASKETFWRDFHPFSINFHQISWVFDGFSSVSELFRSSFATEELAAALVLDPKAGGLQPETWCLRLRGFWSCGPSVRSWNGTRSPGAGFRNGARAS